MSAKETGYKWSKFFWDDWGNDAALQSCNVAAQGLWINLLRVMFNNERQGYLQINNKPMTPTQIAKITGFDSRTITNQLKVLIKNNVCSVDENGIVFSRRMVRESKAKSDKVAATMQRVSNDHAATTQRVRSENVTCMQEEIAENSQKQDPLNKNRIDKNRIDKNKKESNPQTPLNSEQQTQVEPVKTEQEELEDSIDLLSKVSGVPINICKTHSERWLVSLGGNIQLLLRCLDRGNMGSYPIQYTNSIVKNYAGKSNITVLQPKTNKQRMTEEMGLCQNLAEFQAMYPDDEIPDNYQTRSFGRGY